MTSDVDAARCRLPQDVDGDPARGEVGVGDPDAPPCRAGDGGQHRGRLRLAPPRTRVEDEDAHSLGIGLSGVRRLMDEFEISSIAGQGSRVTVRTWRA